MSLNSVVCLLLVVIIFVFGNTEVEGTQGDISSAMITERDPSTACNGTLGECGTRDEVELLLMDIPRNRLLAQAPKKPTFISPDALKQNQKTCYFKCLKKHNPGVPNRPCDRCDYYAIE